MKSLHHESKQTNKHHTLFNCLLLHLQHNNLRIGHQLHTTLNPLLFTPTQSTLNSNTAPNQSIRHVHQSQILQNVSDNRINLLIGQGFIQPQTGRESNGLPWRRCSGDTHILFDICDLFPNANVGGIHGLVV